MWRPIKTAPENKWILVYAGKARKVPTIWIAWKEGKCFTTQDDGALYEPALTHWMELPEKPE